MTPDKRRARAMRSLRLTLGAEAFKLLSRIDMTVGEELTVRGGNDEIRWKFTLLLKKDFDGPDDEPGNGTKSVGNHAKPGRGGSETASVGPT